MIEKPYKANPHGMVAQVSGPGLVLDGMVALYETNKDAELGAEHANVAYKIGYKHAQADMRMALGIPIKS